MIVKDDLIKCFTELSSNDIFIIVVCFTHADVGGTEEVFSALS